MQKVSGLLASDATVIVVSPELRPELKALLDEGRISHIARGYDERDIEGMQVVMVATDDGAVNHQVAADCRARHIWVNASDDPPNCDFILPSVVRKGKITLAASTSGSSPALARRLREELEVYLSDDFEPLADLLAEVRLELRAHHIVVDAETWQRAIDGPLRALLAQHRYGQARARLIARLGVELTPADAAGDQGPAVGMSDA